MITRLTLLIIGLLLASATVAAEVEQPYLVVLGVAQDGGVPQAGNRGHPAWQDPSMRRLAVSLGLVDPQTGQRWLFEATPDIRTQLHRLDGIAPIPDVAPVVSGIFLTHAHMGHYLGLAQLGHEVMGASEIPVHVMPKFAAYLESNGPWSQLVRYRNIELQELADGKTVSLNSRLKVTPFLVPHRQEYSEVVGFIIDGPDCRVLFLPDIDSWETWDEQGTHIEDLIAEVDVAYVDATFYANGEIPGRDMSGFPHPFITHSMKRFANLPASERAKVRFIHMNHTNPALYPGPERQTIIKNGFRVAKELERIPLGTAR